MNNKLTLLPLTILLGLYTNASAIDFDLGLEGYQETYRETDKGQRVMQQQGVLTSGYAGVTVGLFLGHALTFSARYSIGKSDYIGSANSNKNIGVLRINNEGRLSYDLRVAYSNRFAVGNYFIGFFTGFGNRVLFDLPSKESAKLGSYKRKNNLIYSLLGAEINLPLPGKLSINATASYQYVLKGLQVSFVKPKVENKQRKGTGFDAQVLIGYQVDKNRTIKIGPFIRSWHIDRSDVFEYITYKDKTILNKAIEPENGTKEIGIKFNYSYSF